MHPQKLIDCAGQGDNESDAVLLERRWFAAHQAVRAMRAECDILREVMDTAEANWRAARTRLADLNALCDALERQYIGYVSHPATARPPAQLAHVSAA